MRRSLSIALALTIVASAACGSFEDDPDGDGTPTITPEETVTPDSSPAPFEAWCQIDVEGTGTIDMEEDYLPHVIQCENDGAGPEALKAQALSARSYAYYKIDEAGGVQDGVADQVYSCNKTPEQRHFDAVDATRGQFLMYEDTVVAAFFVAGADPDDRDTCIADSGDSDPTNTEKYVTYNEGVGGADLEQTTLGWVNEGNYANRGCMSQWGSRCLDQRGDGYDTIARFYYGIDIVRAQAGGPCIPGTPSSATAMRPPVRKLAPVKLGPSTRRIGH